MLPDGYKSKRAARREQEAAEVDQSRRDRSVARSSLAELRAALSEVHEALRSGRLTPDYVLEQGVAFGLLHRRIPVLVVGKYDIVTPEPYMESRTDHYWVCMSAAGGLYRVKNPSHEDLRRRALPHPGVKVGIRWYRPHMDKRDHRRPRLTPADVRRVLEG